MILINQKHLNNKGMTLIELLVCFTLLIIISFGIFNLILEVRKDLDSKQIIKEYTEYSNNINNKIHYDLIKNKPFVIAYKKSVNDTFICKYSNNTSCSIIGDAISVNYGSNNKISSSLDELCTVYPCAVYGYVNQNNDISFKTIAINKGEKINNSKIYGIKYDKTYESIPNDEYINFNKDKSTVEIDDKGFFVISFSFSMKDNDKDYGFKIAYPFIK